MVSQISKPSIESLHLSSPQDLLSTLQQLRQTVESEGKATFDEWNPHIQRTAFIDSALNLAEYLALRRHDLRSLQAALMPWGLSSLGRIERRVMPNLDAVIATLEVICGSKSDRHFQRPPVEFFFEGDRLLQQHTEELFGESSPRHFIHGDFSIVKLTIEFSWYERYQNAAEMFADIKQSHLWVSPENYDTTLGLNPIYNFIFQAVHDDDHYRTDSDFSLEGEIATYNATINVIEGQGILTLEGKELILEAGVFIFIPATAHHAITAATNIAFLLILSEQVHPHN